MADTDKLREGIAYFEQILQVLPDDRSTLEFLCIAYAQTGEVEKRCKVLSSLAQVLVRERDFESAEKLLPTLGELEGGEIKAAELKLRAMLSAVGVKTAGVNAVSAAAAGGSLPDDKSGAIAAERSLLDWLESTGTIDKELAGKVREQLDALSSAKGVFLISVLSMIESENPLTAEMASAAVADESRTPPIALEAFDQYLALAPELPENFLKMRGAIPFGKVADEMLVALANPMDRILRKQISAYFGGKCHFYFVPPLSLNLVLAKLFPEAGK